LKSSKRRKKNKTPKIMKIKEVGSMQLCNQALEEWLESQKQIQRKKDCEVYYQSNNFNKIIIMEALFL
jgi:hypothetical protein